MYAVTMFRYSCVILQTFAILKQCCYKYKELYLSANEEDHNMHALYDCIILRQRCISPLCLM
jgi:hypothetical protein